MKSIKFMAVTLTCAALIGCGQKEEPKPVPEEMPVNEMPLNADSLRADSLRIDSLMQDSLMRAKASGKKTVKKMSTTVQKNEDGTASGAQIRASRDEKKEGEASGGTIRKSR
ncbi:MAG: hypothetical protein HQ472_11050 [Ignavibacteria bacterium]|nr:hypothetical protein [Ignavibacteria bacterium]